MRLRLFRTFLIALGMLPALLLPGKGETDPKPESDSVNGLLLDATWVPCSDSTESLYVFQDGRAVYAWANSGILFTVGESTLKKVAGVIARMESTVDTASLDTCTTLGVILAGPRYLLINSRAPSQETTLLCDQLEALRKYARRKIERDIERTLTQIEKRPNTGVKTDPALDPDTLQQYIYESPIAASWRCRGSVTVTAQVDARGIVRRAFAQNAEVKGKCGSLLVMTALRAVALSSFEPAMKIEGSAGAAWMNIIVSFGKKSVGSRKQSVGGGRQ